MSPFSVNWLHAVQCSRLSLTLCVTLVLLSGDIVQGQHHASSSIFPPVVGVVHVSQAAIDTLFHDAGQTCETLPAGLGLPGSIQARVSAKIRLQPNPDACQLVVSTAGDVDYMLPESTESITNWKFQSDSELRWSSNGLRLVETSIQSLDSNWKQADQEAAAQHSWLSTFGQSIVVMQDDLVRSRLQRQLHKRLVEHLKTYDQRLREQKWVPNAIVQSLFSRVRLESTSKLAIARILASEAEWPALSRSSSRQTTHDVHFAVHESLVEDLARETLGGYRVSDSQIAQHVERMRGTLPWELWVHDRRAKWSFTWQALAPVSITFSGDQIHVTLRGDDVQIGDEYFSAPFQVTASFEPRREPDPHFIRVVGPHVHIESGFLAVEKERLLADHLQRKFAAILAEEVHFDGLVPPVGGCWDRFRLFQLVEFTADANWFHVGFERK